MPPESYAVESVVDVVLGYAVNLILPVGPAQALCLFGGTPVNVNALELDNTEFFDNELSLAESEY